MRLDVYLKEYKNIKSRSRASLLIESDRVKVNGEIRVDASYKVKDGDIVEVEDMIYVSRAGYKLDYAVKYLRDKKIAIDIKDKICLDIGSSTGGFTDYLLQNEAHKVYSVDVGTGQFDNDLLLKYKDKISLFENTDIRDFQKSEMYKNYFDIVVCDVSFISLSHIIDSIKYFIRVDGYAVILFKPQFEVGKGNTKKGIVTDKDLLQKTIEERVKDFDNAGLKVIEIFESGILGGDGNTEYVFYVKCDK